MIVKENKRKQNSSIVFAASMLSVRETIFQTKCDKTEIIQGK